MGGVEEEWGGIEGGETVIRIYCKRKELISIRGENKIYKEEGRLAGKI